MEVVLSFFIYSFLGWVSECLYCGIPAKKFINRGFLAGPYCPIYGSGAMLVMYLLTSFESNPLVLFLMGVLVTSILEYLTSYFMELFFHTKWWDYSDYPCNLHGRICLKNSCLFGILVLIVYYGIHPITLAIIAHMPYYLQCSITLIVTVIFAYDATHTTVVILRNNKEVQEIEQSLKELYSDFTKGFERPLQESLKDVAKRVLDATQVDDVMVQHVNNFHEKMQLLKKHKQKTHTRLHDAFPTMKEQLRKFDAQSIYEVIEDWKQKHN